MATTKTSALRPSGEGYSYREVKTLASVALDAGLSVLLRGHPGVGKSTLARDLAAGLGLPLHDIRLAQREPAELCGVHFPNRERRVLELLPPDWVRAVCDVPGFIFLDEINAAVTRLHQAAAYQIVLERRVGPYAFHPQTVVMAAGNLDGDQSLVTPLSAALNNRFMHLQLRVDTAAWLDWASGAGVHPAVLAYIGSQGHLGDSVLYNPTGDDAFASPRSWEMASRVFHRAAGGEARRLVAACVGIASAEKFAQFLRIHQRIDPRAIVERGKTIDFSSQEASFAYAAVYAVADYVLLHPELSAAALSHVIAFLGHQALDPEMRFLFLRHLRRNATVIASLKAHHDYARLAGELVDLRLEVSP